MSTRVTNAPPLERSALKSTGRNSRNAEASRAKPQSPEVQNRKVRNRRRPSKLVPEGNQLRRRNTDEAHTWAQGVLLSLVTNEESGLSSRHYYGARVNGEVSPAASLSYSVFRLPSECDVALYT
ncbi:hypothetical protein NDU88_002058 [Pleurodeles waltl]|uniref:Uncharacterized protein n=1 Tax=Pleurodeles waltl TaxID=8319 RepID=A0AAV7V9I6_PLEWA|nr:hypothetical protein NDU88_002058 [Pleurodeles waltl]